MADRAEVDSILEMVYSLTLGLDYDQPTSLERELDVLADEIMSAELCGEDFEPNTADGYLSEVLGSLDAQQLQHAIDASGEIADILGRMEYGGLGGNDARNLEKWVDVLVTELEGYFDALKQEAS